MYNVSDHTPAIYSSIMINQTTSGLERQIGPFSGRYLDIGPGRDQVPKSGPFREHCMKFQNKVLVNRSNHHPQREVVNKNQLYFGILTQPALGSSWSAHIAKPHLAIFSFLPPNFKSSLFFAKSFYFQKKLKWTIQAFTAIV